MSIRTLRAHDWFHSDGFPIAVERRDPQGPFGPHAHEFSELVLITGGRGLHVTGGESWPLAAGDVFVIGGTRPHHYREMERLCLVNLLFQPRRLHWETADLKALPGYHALFTLEPAWRSRHRFRSRLHISPAELGTVTGYVDRLDEELRERRPAFGFLATAWFMLIVGYLSRCYGRAKNPDSRALLRIAEAITHLETHAAEPVNLESLAGIAHMSKRNFCRAFQAAMGSSPISHLIRLRVNRAAALLRRGGGSITDIAFDVGFNDSNYFARQFRQVLGLSPREYRGQQRRLGV
jgi:AraC family L-rhamnose operon transcriptional activator RhaR/AraC family L-rhamnose operon regulatory protein RhaS